MIYIIRRLLQNCIDRIDAGNSNLSDNDCIEVIRLLKKYTEKDVKLSKYQACQYLNVSRATFDNYIRTGKLPRGQKEQGFKELFWTEESLKKYLHNYKQNS